MSVPPDALSAADFLRRAKNRSDHRRSTSSHGRDSAILFRTFVLRDDRSSGSSFFRCSRNAEGFARTICQRRARKAADKTICFQHSYEQVAPRCLIGGAVFANDKTEQFRIPVFEIIASKEAMGAQRFRLDVVTRAESSRNCFAQYL